MFSLAFSTLCWQLLCKAEDSLCVHVLVFVNMWGTCKILTLWGRVVVVRTVFWSSHLSQNKNLLQLGFRVKLTHRLLLRLGLGT